MPIVVWPDPEWHPFDHWKPSDAGSIMVEDTEEPEALRSSILGPDGKPLIYQYASDKQHFIGFVSPEEIERIRESQQRIKRRRKRRATTVKSEA